MLSELGGWIGLEQQSMTFIIQLLDLGFWNIYFKYGIENVVTV